MKKLSDKARAYISEYKKQLYGREVEGTVELLKEVSDKLEKYEDLEEQGKLLKLPCAVGDTIYTNYSMPGWYFRKEKKPYAAKIVFIGINRADNYINADFGNGYMFQFKFSDIGKKFFLTKREAERALKETEGESV